MKKKYSYLAASLLTTALVASTFAVCLSDTKVRASIGEIQLSTITINSLENATVIDNTPAWKQVNVKNNLFDFLGANEGSTIEIGQKTYGVAPHDVTYLGMVYNRSMINGFKSLTVNYTGSNLYAVFTEYLMEDMDFVQDSAHLVTSGTKIDVDSSNGYFVLYTSGETTINELEVKYACDASLDESLLYDSGTVVGSARSSAKVRKVSHDLINIENNPTATTNVYSTGSHGGNPDAWYRWNGVDLPKRTDDLGQHFEIHTTIIGNISQITYAHENSEDNLFHFAVWPQVLQPSTSQYPNWSGWGYAYVGDDNYDPYLVKDSAQDAHAAYCYSGRFFAKYDSEGEFANPDTNYTLDTGSTTTLRQAYEMNKLPFWHVVIEYDGEYNRTYMNGHFVYQEESFYDYHADEGMYINRIDLHVVNFGQTDGTPASSYKGTFTTPRVKNLAVI